MKNTKYRPSAKDKMQFSEQLPKLDFWNIVCVRRGRSSAWLPKCLSHWLGHGCVQRCVLGYVQATGLTRVREANGINIFFVFSIGKNASIVSLNHEKKVIKATAKMTPGKA